MSQVEPKIKLEACYGTHRSHRWLPWGTKLPFRWICVPVWGHLGSILEGCWGSGHDFGGYWAHMGGSSVLKKTVPKRDPGGRGPRLRDHAHLGAFGLFGAATGGTSKGGTNFQSTI